MNRYNPHLAREDLAFMGKVNASISHELKNIMAIISETSGLLNDLMGIVEVGESAEADTIRECCRDIDEEIQRGFDTIRQMNRFAHSTDEEECTVGLDGVLEMMTGLAGFLSYACDVRPAASTATDIEVRTSPLRLQNLIYRALIYAFHSAGTKGTVTVAVRSEAGGVRIAFSGFKASADASFPTDGMQRIADAIGARVGVAADGRGVEISLPGPA